MTDTVNTLVSLAVPFDIVAVKVTSVVLAGLVTTPVVLTMLGLLETQVIVDPFDPLVGNPRFPVTLVCASPAEYKI
jgi:hypothetical protein